jgi:hypothetical protein
MLRFIRKFYKPKVVEESPQPPQIKERVSFLEGEQGLVISILEVIDGKLYQVLRENGQTIWLRPEEIHSAK